MKSLISSVSIVVSSSNFIFDAYFTLGWPNPTHVSMNHGIFLCVNCATGIHIEHYPVEVSFIKAIKEDEFNYCQLNVLINGGNKAAFDFFEVYDLQHEPVQKRYNTLAAQFYREKLRDLVNQTNTSKDGSMPAIETGR